MLKVSNNIWIDNPVIIFDMVQSYFMGLFKEHNSTTGKCQPNEPITSHPSLSREDYTKLCAPISHAEIWSTVKGIQPYKAAGPDRIHVIFYQKYWNVVGDEVFQFSKVVLPLMLCQKRSIKPSLLWFLSLRILKTLKCFGLLAYAMWLTRLSQRLSLPEWDLLSIKLWVLAKVVPFQVGLPTIISSPPRKYFTLWD